LKSDRSFRKRNLELTGCALLARIEFKNHWVSKTTPQYRDTGKRCMAGALPPDLS